MALDIHQFEIGNFKNFVYLIVSQGEALVVDPQRELKVWEDVLEKTEAKLRGCLLTHSHWDHVAGVPEVARKYMVPVWVHPGETHRLYSMPQPVQREIRPLDPEVPILIGDCVIEVIHTPGHSSGECCFLIKHPDSAPQLLTGDTVFVGDVGRCDLDTASVSQMFESLQKLKRLSPQTVVWPGHNYGARPSSTIAEESATSPAFQCVSIEELDALP